VQEGKAAAGRWGRAGVWAHGLRRGGAVGRRHEDRRPSLGGRCAGGIRSTAEPTENAELRGYGFAGDRAASGACAIC
jgi:hypothetical protein